MKHAVHVLLFTLTIAFTSVAVAAEPANADGGTSRVEEASAAPVIPSVVGTRLPRVNSNEDPACAAVSTETEPAPEEEAMNWCGGDMCCIYKYFLDVTICCVMFGEDAGECVLW
jgi:hypothetical protein